MITREQWIKQGHVYMYLWLINLLNGNPETGYREIARLIYDNNQTGSNSTANNYVFFN